MSKRQADSPLNLDFLKRKLKKYQNLIDELSTDKHESDISVRSDDEGSDHDELSESDLEKKTVPKTDSGNKVPRTPQDNDTNNSEIIELPEKARDLLGVEKRRQKDLSFEFHPELVACWKETLSKGMEASTKKEILEKYPDKGNINLKAPILNPELLPLLHKSAVGRDKHLASNQNLCGLSLVSLGKALCAMFSDDEEPLEKDDILELLCDSSNIMCELIFQLEKARKTHVYQYVESKRKTVLEESVTDEFLFGKDLSKRIKDSSTVEKAGLTLKSQPEQKTFVSRKRFLNWKSPATSRGGPSQSGFNRKPFQKFGQFNRSTPPQTRSLTISKGHQSQSNNTK
ncbi:uncharacterized protein LOC130668594 [Microplitis mediator]|uniref:uncharacterized protein LOC130668594 n=1 Tax=Microplitis mediator TaxID=375433 RepID=UPI0025524E8F|nr:uncharacterized protein LOC130668594 [Microplitis mediator]